MPSHYRPIRNCVMASTKASSGLKAVFPNRRLRNPVVRVSAQAGAFSDWFSFTKPKQQPTTESERSVAESPPLTTQSDVTPISAANTVLPASPYSTLTAPRRDYLEARQVPVTKTPSHRQLCMADLYCLKM